MAEEEEIERLLIESDMGMIPREELMVLEFDEETRSFSCRKYDHLFYSAEALENHDKTSHGNDKCFSCRSCNKEFPKDRHKLLHEGHCLGRYYFRDFCILFKAVESVWPYKYFYSVYWFGHLNLKF